MKQQATLWPITAHTRSTHTAMRRDARKAETILGFSCRRVSDESNVLWRICSRDDQRIDTHTRARGQFGEVIWSINTFETFPVIHLRSVISEENPLINMTLSFQA